MPVRVLPPGSGVSAASCTLRLDGLVLAYLTFASASASLTSVLRARAAVMGWSLARGGVGARAGEKLSRRGRRHKGPSAHSSGRAAVSGGRGAQKVPQLPAGIGEHVGLDAGPALDQLPGEADLAAHVEGGGADDGAGIEIEGDGAAALH